MGASTSGAGVDGVLFGGVAPAGSPWVGLTAVDDGPGARRRRVAVAGVSLMGAAALSTAVFQTVAGTSTSLAMTPGLGALFAGSSTPAPQGPTSQALAVRPTGLAAPAITDLGPVPVVVAPTTATQVDLQAQRGPLPGPGELAAGIGVPAAVAPVAAGPAGGSGAPAAGAPAGAGPVGAAPGGSAPGGAAPGGAAPGGAAPGGSTTTRPTTTTPTSAPPTTTTRPTPPSTTRPPTTTPSTTTAPSGSAAPSSPTSAAPPRSSRPRSSAPSSKPSEPPAPKPSPSSGSSKPAGGSAGSDKPSSGGSGS
ncbi:MAG TPA: hypothetical protein VGH76_24500 [Actinomycetospora sp.]|uniref:hypothetical protein n=1 Tax=Actinomycetospora sp. TaxID=1872135 RepID=UPI002F402F13